MIRFVILLTVLCISIPKYGFCEIIELICEGEVFMYDIGFGSRDNIKFKGNKKIFLNKESNTIKADTFFGERTASLNTTNEHYTAKYVHNTEYKNAYIIEETVTLDRYTGDVGFILKIKIGNNDAMYGSFDGKCKKGKKIF